MNKKPTSMTPVKQQDQSNLKWVADFIWNIADDRLRDIYVRGWVPGPDDVVAEEYLAVLGGDEEIDTEGEADDGEEE
jgi:hypothetical protein